MTRYLALLSFVASGVLISHVHASAQSAGAPTPRASQSRATVVFAGGCYWTMENIFQHVRGVTDVVAGLATGDRAVDSAGIAEAVTVSYDTSLVSYAELLRVFFMVAHDPTQLDRQGPDVGTRYRSEVFYEDDAQRRAANEFIASLEHERRYDRSIVTRVVPLDRFIPVAADQQDFAARHPDNPYIRMYDPPKLDRFRHELPELYREGLPVTRETNASPLGSARPQN
jgi:peptide-methionine (S)-S-oxide reductase